MTELHESGQHRSWRVCFRPAAAVVSLLLLLSMSGCDALGSLFGDPEPETGTITIRPLRGYLLSDIAIRRVASVDEEGVASYEEQNYAMETEIHFATTYTVPVGEYYVFLRYHDFNTGYSGWWQTLSPNRIHVAAGENWVVKYG